MELDGFSPNLIRSRFAKYFLAGSLAVGSFVSCSSKEGPESKNPTSTIQETTIQLPEIESGQYTNPGAETNNNVLVTDLLPVANTDHDGEIFNNLEEIDASDQYVTMWRGAAVKELILNLDESLYVRIDNPVELTIDDLVYWVGYDYSNDTYIKLPVGEVIGGQPQYDDRYRNINPYSFTDENSGQFVDAQVTNLTQNGFEVLDYFEQQMQMLDTSRTGELSVKPRAYVYASLEDAIDDPTLNEVLHLGIDDDTDNFLFRDEHVIESEN